MLEGERNGYRTSLKGTEGFAFAHTEELMPVVIDGRQVQEHGHFSGGATAHAACNGREGPGVEGRRDGPESWSVGRCGHGSEQVRRLLFITAKDLRLADTTQE
jgi:hypothetical protein